MRSPHHVVRLALAVLAIISGSIRLAIGLRAATINAGGATDFCARCLDEHDAPIKTITVNLASGSTR